MNARPKMARTGDADNVAPTILFDRYLLFASIALAAIGLLMVYSTSIVISDKAYGGPFHYLVRQAVYLLLGLGLGAIVARVELSDWLPLGGFLLLATLILLILVLVPGVGRQVNGGMRWIGVSVLGLQVSELAKFTVVVYLAGYLVRHQDEVRTRVIGFIKPMLLLGLVAALLMREPDFGATTVIMATALGMMFLSGVRVWQFGVLLGVVVAGLGGLAIASPYRIARLTSFLNPWATQYDSGYQLTQALIAFGRGGWFGT